MDIDEGAGTDPSFLVSLLPAVGPAGGFDEVTLSGTGFLGATGVTSSCSVLSGRSTSIPRSRTNVAVTMKKMSRMNTTSSMGVRSTWESSAAEERLRFTDPPPLL